MSSATAPMILCSLPGARFHYAIRRVEGVPVVAVRVLLRGGSRLEEVPGQAVLCGRMLSEGTGREDWRQIAERFEDRGMFLQSFGTLEAHGLAVDTLASDWQQSLAFTAELLFESRFPEERLRWLASQASAELESLGDQPEVRTSWSFYDHLYHPHPAARPLQGTAAALAAMRAEQCSRFHEQALRRGAVVVVTGEVEPTAIEASLAGLFADLGGAAEESPPPLEPVGRPEQRRGVRTDAAEQSHLYLGHLTVPRVHPDVPALQVAAVVLGAGAGLTGRIPTRVREREGLAYSAQASTLAGAGLDPGWLGVYLGTAPESLQRAEAAVLEELERLRTGGVLAQEVADAKAFLLGREPFRRETARQWADRLCEALFYDLPLYRDDWARERLAGVDVAAVDEAVRRHLDLERIKVTVGSAAGEA